MALKSAATHLTVRLTFLSCAKFNLPTYVKRSLVIKLRIYLKSSCSPSKNQVWTIRPMETRSFFGLFNFDGNFQLSKKKLHSSLTFNIWLFELWINNNNWISVTKKKIEQNLTPKMLGFWEKKTYSKRKPFAVLRDLN